MITSRMRSLFALAALTSVVVPLGPAASAPLPRADIVLPSAISVDPTAGVVTLPLHRGTAAGVSVWYIITDSSDKDDATRRRVVYAPLLTTLADGCHACVRAATETHGQIAFPGAPNFAPSRLYVVSATGFPPLSAAPGATSSATYTPFVKVGPAVLNAPIVATGDGPFDTRTHRNTQDRVIAIDIVKRTVTLALAKGFFGGKPIVYLSTEASDPGAATVERATYVPQLKPSGGTVPIDVIANGSHQGLGYVALHGNLAANATAANAASLGSAMNVLSTFPLGATAAAYSPLWAVTVVAWKPQALAAGRDRILKSIDDVSAVSTQTTGPGGKAVGPVGFVVNCPVIAILDGKR